jgi:hypothetical protein
MPIAAQQQNDMQTQDAKPFNGTIAKEKGKFVLKSTSGTLKRRLREALRDSFQPRDFVSARLLIQPSVLPF